MLFVYWNRHEIKFILSYLILSMTLTSWWARRRLKSPASRLFTQPFIQTQIKENIKAPRHWPLCGEFTGDRWIPSTNGQQRGKCFYLMTSSCNNHHSDSIETIPSQEPMRGVDRTWKSKHRSDHENKRPRNTALRPYLVLGSDLRRISKPELINSLINLIWCREPGVVQAVQCPRGCSGASRLHGQRRRNGMMTSSHGDVFCITGSVW